MPPEICEGNFSACSRSPTCSSLIFTMMSMVVPSSSVCSRSGSATFSATVMLLNSAPDWNRMPK